MKWHRSTLCLSTTTSLLAGRRRSRRNKGAHHEALRLGKHTCHDTRITDAPPPSLACNEVTILPVCRSASSHSTAALLSCVGKDGALCVGCPITRIIETVDAVLCTGMSYETQQHRAMYNGAD
eukprot:scaffold7983_cov45-Attheya_sp.AAC.4